LPCAGNPASAKQALISDSVAPSKTGVIAWNPSLMPFAGRRQSGYNTGGIGYTMQDMTQDKMTVIKL